MYFEEIEKYFCKKKEKSLILSPKDWLIVKEWFKEGIPLFVIIQGIDETFANSPNPKKINSISYCKSGIESLWEVYKENLVGSVRKNTNSKNTNISSFVLSRIDEIIQGIWQGARGKGQGARVYKKILSLFENLKNELSKDKNLDLSIAEEKFNQTQEKILLHLKNQLGEKTEEIEKQINEELKGYQKKMSLETYEETKKHIFQKEILKKFNLTNIGLYD